MGVFQKYGLIQFEFFEKPASANYFQTERENTYDYFLMIYITKLQIQSKFRFGSDARRFTPPKQKIWLVLTKPYCLVANQMGEFCEKVALN